MSAPISGPARWIHHPFHSPEMIAGPRLRAGFVLVPVTGDSAYTIMAYKNGNSAGVYGRSYRKPRNIHNPAIIRKFVSASPINTSAGLYPGPGNVAPNAATAAMCTPDRDCAAERDNPHGRHAPGVSPKEYAVRALPCGYPRRRVIASSSFVASGSFARVRFFHSSSSSSAAAFSRNSGAAHLNTSKS